MLLPLFGAAISACGTSAGSHARGSATASRYSGTRVPVVHPFKSPTALPASAYTATLYGRVVDARTRSPIRGATITIGTASGHRLARGSASGSYRAAFPGQLPTTVQATKPGYVGQLGIGTIAVHQAYKLNFKLVKITAGIPPQPSPPFVFGQAARKKT